MKNVIILYYPPFRGGQFPIHFMQDLKGYNFFLLVIKEDLEQHKKFETLNYVKEVITVNYTIENLIEYCKDIQKKYGIIHNIIYLDENSVQLCGELLKYFDISPNNLDRYSDKWAMSEKLKSSEVRIPKGILFSDDEYNNHSTDYLLEIEKIIGNYPLFIKPRDLSGSRGTSLILNRKEFISWTEHKDKLSYLVQEYLDGKLLHCECFIKNYEILDSFVFEYSQPGFFFSKGFPVGSISLPLNHPIKKRVSSFTKDVLQGLGIIKNGVTHIEVYLNRNDELIFLEAAARPPGLVGNLLYKKYLNISINEIHLLLQLEEFHQHLFDFKVNNYSARHIFPFTKTGKITKLINKPLINSAFFENFTHNIGDEVKKSDNFFNTAGTIVLWNKNYDELRKDFLTLSNYNPYEIEPQCF